jgi:ribosomal protein L19E
MRRAGQNIRKLVKDGFVIRKPTKARSPKTLVASRRSAA